MRNLVGLFLDLSERFDARLQGAGKIAEDETFPVPMPDESAMRQRFWILEEHCGGGTSLRQAVCNPLTPLSVLSA
jgi:hypothetical protein